MKVGPNVRKKNKPAGSTKADMVCIISDIHFNLHDVPTWNAFKKWHKEIKPKKTVVLGDFVDLGMLSRYAQGDDDPVYAVDQIKEFIKEINPFTEYSEVFIVDGNHDDRWAKMLKGKEFAYKDAKGLTLKEQCYMQGLSKKTQWVTEDVNTRGIKCGPFTLRHGHQQSGRFGGGKHLCLNKLDKTFGESEVFGHHHRAQLACKTVGDKTAIVIANPSMTINHNYNVDPDWQRGFTVLELYGKNNEFATPYIMIIQDGHFSYKGRVYDGNVK